MDMLTVHVIFMIIVFNQEIIIKTVLPVSYSGHDSLCPVTSFFVCCHSLVCCINFFLSSCTEPEVYKEVKQKLDDGSVKFEVTTISFLKYLFFGSSVCSELL